MKVFSSISTVNSSSYSSAGAAVKYTTASMLLACLIGLLLSVYATHVEIKVEHDRSYQAMCDISERMSCTKVFSSRYGKGFGIVGRLFGDDSQLNLPNGEMGIAFYILIAILAFIDNQHLAKIQLILCAISNLVSLYLAYLLYFVLEDLCVVCVSTYAVNFVCLLLSWKHYMRVRAQKMTTQCEVKNGFVRKLD